ncbi:MAG: pilus assembly protein [Alphaproteobacteria bacterium]|nr:MAG: pilus assembly protein [Alphaproteobacteria bacterium]
MIWRKLRKDTQGATMVEFAFTAPVLLLLTIGMLEIGMIEFMGSTIENAVLDASRYGATGFAPEAKARDEAIRESIADWTMGLVDMETVKIETKVYPSFDDIGKPEPYTDSNGNGSWDVGEPYSDINGNGQWDNDMGQAGLGGPGEVVLYRVEYEWGIMTPLIQNILDNITFSSSIAVRNEPF